MKKNKIIKIILSTIEQLLSYHLYFWRRLKLRKKSQKIAKQLSDKPERAMKLTKKRIWEMFKKDMNDVFEKAKIYHKESFNSGEPQKKSKYFLKK